MATRKQWHQRLSAEEIADIVARLREQNEAAEAVAGDYGITAETARHIAQSVADPTTEAAEQFLVSYDVSYKAKIIEVIFDKRWDAQAGQLASTLIKLDDITEGIEEYNELHHTEWNAGNRANFFKDFVRNLDTANQNWPRSVWERGYTGWQLTGQSRSFEFLPIPEGQTVPFVKIEPVPPEQASRIGTLNLPLESQRLGREDESWLTQVAVKLTLIESHFALSSPREMREIVHLQMNVKHSGAEIDSMYRALEQVGNDDRRAVIVCEAKGRRDDILLSQLVAQAQTAFRMPTLMEYDEVTLVAIKILGPSDVQIVDFAPVVRVAAATQRQLQVASNARYLLVPPVTGIS